MSTCRICGETLKMNTGTLKYGARVNLCPRCRTPYIDPKIIELAAVPARDRENHRMRYAKQTDRKRTLIAAAVFTLALVAFTSNSLVHGLLPMLLVCAAVYACLHAVGFCAKYFLVFPLLARDSARRMQDSWYLTRMRACFKQAA